MIFLPLLNSFVMKCLDMKNPGCYAKAPEPRTIVNGQTLAIQQVGAAKHRALTIVREVSIRPHRKLRRM
jgi:hypothetical protein